MAEPLTFGHNLQAFAIQYSNWSVLYDEENEQILKNQSTAGAFVVRTPAGGHAAVLRGFEEEPEEGE
jgi:hypothetical protein